MTAALCLCGRAPGSFAWHDFSQAPFDRGEPIRCCSTPCLNIVTRRKGQMNLRVDERQAVKDASSAVGEYLDRIGKTDLATMTEDEWLGFIGHTYATVCNAVRDIIQRECPF